MTECEGRQDCNEGKRCLTHGLWSELSDQLYGFLDGIPLGRLMRESGIGNEENNPQLGTKRVGIPTLEKAKSNVEMR